jgi:hypothetical protein
MRTKRNKLTVPVSDEKEEEVAPVTESEPAVVK